MNFAMLTWLTLGACLVYLVAMDSNVYIWLVLLTKVAGVWFQRQWFLFRYNPDSPWVRYAIYRNANKLAKEILKENKNR